MNSAHSYTEGADYTEPDNNIEEFLKETEPTKELFDGDEEERTELLPDVAYWRHRCLLVEKAMEGRSMHPTHEQVKAHKDYNQFLETFGKKD